MKTTHFRCYNSAIYSAIMQTNNLKVFESANTKGSQQDSQNRRWLPN
jgi:hypothetical protein